MPPWNSPPFDRRVDVGEDLRLLSREARFREDLGERLDGHILVSDGGTGLRGQFCRVFGEAPRRIATELVLLKQLIACSVGGEFAVEIGCRDAAVHEEAAAGDESAVGAPTVTTSFFRGFRPSHWG